MPGRPGADGPHRQEREFQTSQIEIGSPPGLALSSIRHSLALLRAALADAAERADVRLLAIGTGPVDGPGRGHRLRQLALDRVGTLAIGGPHPVPGQP
nr:hypothetical protein [Micromonospora sonchi]